MYHCNIFKDDDDDHGGGNDYNDNACLVRLGSCLTMIRKIRFYVYATSMFRICKNPLRQQLNGIDVSTE
jgi:hypothetical protein